MRESGVATTKISPKIKIPEVKVGLFLVKARTLFRNGQVKAAKMQAMMKGISTLRRMKTRRRAESAVIMEEVLGPLSRNSQNPDEFPVFLVVSLSSVLILSPEVAVFAALVWLSLAFLRKSEDIQGSSQTTGCRWANGAVAVMARDDDLEGT